MDSELDRRSLAAADVSLSFQFLLLLLEFRTELKSVLYQINIQPKLFYFSILTIGND